MGIITHLPSGTSINGTKTSKYVYTGQTVEAGDFVQYKTGVASTNTFTSTTNTNVGTPVRALSDTKFLAISGTTLKLVEINKTTGAYTTKVSLALKTPLVNYGMIKWDTFVYVHKVDSVPKVSCVRVNLEKNTLTDLGKLGTIEGSHNYFTKNIANPSENAATFATYSSEGGSTNAKGYYVYLDEYDNIKVVYDQNTGWRRKTAMPLGDNVCIGLNAYSFGAWKVYPQQRDLSNNGDVVNALTSNLGVMKWDDDSTEGGGIFAIANDELAKDVMVVTRYLDDSVVILYYVSTNCTVTTVKASIPVATETTLYTLGHGLYCYKEVSNGATTLTLYKNGVSQGTIASNSLIGNLISIGDSSLPVLNSISGTRYLEVGKSFGVKGSSMRSLNMEEQVIKCPAGEPADGIAIIGGTGGSTTTHGNPITVYAT